MKVKVADNYCKGCVWLVDGRLCPFARCVRRRGFLGDNHKVISRSVQGN